MCERERESECVCVSVCVRVSSVPHSSGQVRGGGGCERDHLLHCQPQLHPVKGVGNPKLLFQFCLSYTLEETGHNHTFRGSLGGEGF